MFLKSFVLLDHEYSWSMIIGLFLFVGFLDSGFSSHEVRFFFFLFV